ncbi:hypothetical protein ACFLXC_03920, partial [Chloroflexota bacterium]
RRELDLNGRGFVRDVKQIALSPHIGQIPCLSFSFHIFRQRLQMPFGRLSGAGGAVVAIVTILRLNPLCIIYAQVKRSGQGFVVAIRLLKCTRCFVCCSASSSHNKTSSSLRRNSTFIVPPLVCITQLEKQIAYPNWKV